MKTLMGQKENNIIIGLIVVLLVVIVVMVVIYFKKEKMTTAVDSYPMGYGSEGNPGLRDSSWFPEQEQEKGDFYGLEDKSLKQNVRGSGQDGPAYDYNGMLVDTLGGDLKENHRRYADEMATHTGTIRYLGVHQDYSFPGAEPWGVNAFRPKGTDGGTVVAQRNDLPSVTSHTDTVEHAKMFNYSPDNYDQFI